METTGSFILRQGRYASIEQEVIYETTPAQRLGVEFGGHFLGQSVTDIGQAPNYVGVGFSGLSLELRYLTIPRSEEWPFQLDSDGRTRVDSANYDGTATTRIIRAGRSASRPWAPAPLACQRRSRITSRDRSGPASRLARCPEAALAARTSGLDVHIVADGRSRGVSQECGFVGHGTLLGCSRRGARMGLWGGDRSVAPGGAADHAAEGAAMEIWILVGVHVSLDVPRCRNWRPRENANRNIWRWSGSDRPPHN